MKVISTNRLHRQKQHYQKSPHINFLTPVEVNHLKAKAWFLLQGPPISPPLFVSGGHRVGSQRQPVVAKMLRPGRVLRLQPTPMQRRGVERLQQRQRRRHP